MRGDRVNWGEWYDFFSKRSDRPMPAPEANDLYLKLPKSLAESLAIFQLGESGGGTVISQARKSSIKVIDAQISRASKRREKLTNTLEQRRINRLLNTTPSNSD